ncbi:twin-arginine translocase subunit TatB [Corallincola luteus]|uniref:Sec-independent protein translocase protein TatB n=1 Tax=Corallincola luteus TaxID=1775177 RepID=A0ABY2AIV4_9GAMM|nr:Sec-independent protein translocase protein TatB [Corallincola luteus]TCI02652.1 twin-arginine translocase subunit TatB [Corallincola luteus]
MFDIGFWELVIIAVVGLLVLGPERLPGAVRSVTRTISSVKRYGSAIRSQVEQELEIEQLHNDLKKAEALGTKVTPELQASLNKLRAQADAVNRPYAAEEPEAQVDGDSAENKLDVEEDLLSANDSGHREYPGPDDKVEPLPTPSDSKRQ